MGTLITNGRISLRCLSAGVTSVAHILYIVLPSTGIQEAARIFCDDTETVYMKYVEDDGREVEFRNFTVLVDIVPETFGTRIGMRQPYLDEVAIEDGT